MDRDSAASTVAAATYSVALGTGSVALPLLALRAGYSATEVGILTAASAVGQIVSRFGLGALMRRVPDWYLVAASGVVLVISSGVVVGSAAWVPFLLAQVLQGASRALFWTGAQTHVMRGNRPAASRLAVFNLAAGAGFLGGPLLAGVLSEETPELAMGVAAGVAAVGILPTFLLDRLPPFAQPQDRPRGRLWRRPDVNLGCWAAVTSAGWYGVLTSYVPVVLDEAGHSASAIGVLVTLSHTAALVGVGASGRIPTRVAVPVLLAGIVLTGTSTAMTGVAASSALLSGVLLAIAGGFAGMLQVLGLAVATQSVDSEERGDVVNLSGVFRSVALFSVPLGTAGLVLLVPLVPALAAVGVALSLPAVMVGVRRRSDPPPSER